MTFRKVNIGVDALNEAIHFEELVVLLEDAGAHTGEFDTIDDILDYVAEKDLKGIAFNDKFGLDVDLIHEAFKAHGIRTNVLIKENI